MNKISSPWTRFIKWSSPIVWIGGIGYVLLDSAFDAAFFAVLAGIAALGLLLMKLFIWSLADEVYDCGDSLLVRRGGIEESVALGNVEDVTLARFSRPPRITLRLTTPGKFGKAIVFTPPTSPGLEIFGRNPIAESLKAKVQRAR